MYTIESSRDLKSGETTTTSKTGGDVTQGFSSDSSGNVGFEGSACGWGIKGTGSINGGAAGAGVEGAIFFTKAP